MTAQTQNDPVTSLELVSDREIVIRRTFDAPARIVFSAWTNPGLLKRWWAPRSRGVEVVACESELRTGGRYRIVMRRGADADMAFSGEYREVEPPTRLVYTEVFEPMAKAGAVIITLTLDEKEGRTRLTMHSLYPSQQVRDAVIATGMEKGMRESMDQLAVLLAELAARQA
jgi:uncharacterized protein YndB with AHSA1/START domain